jgi:hypothetical protein
LGLGLFWSFLDLLGGWLLLSLLVLVLLVLLSLLGLRLRSLWLWGLNNLNLSFG